MNWELTVSRQAFSGLVERMTHSPDQVLICPGWLTRDPGRVQVLLHSLDFSPSVGHHSGARIVVASSPHKSELTGRIRRIMRHPPAAAPAVYLGIGVAEAAGHLIAESVSWEGVRPLALVRVVAETLPEVRLNDQNPVALDFELSERWSRSRSALGEETWRRLASLRIALFGCGRTGSLMANALARSGVTQLKLIDPDRMELHNFGEMDVVRSGDLGRNKAESVADGLRLVCETPVEDVAEKATSWAALAAAKEADVLISCVDNSSARLAVDLLARLYLKPLVDVGTGVLAAGPLAKRMGADVRFLLPGHCLGCYGGLNAMERAAAELIVGRTEISDWRQERAGSLRSLNMVAAGTALRLLEDFVAGRISETVWLNLEYADGTPAFRRMTVPARTGSCRVCALTGLGDSGLDETPALLASLSGRESTRDFFENRVPRR